VRLRAIAFKRLAEPLEAISIKILIAFSPELDQALPIHVVETVHPRPWFGTIRPKAGRWQGFRLLKTQSSTISLKTNQYPESHLVLYSLNPVFNASCH
jgi:hypothetical protein